LSSGKEHRLCFATGHDELDPDEDSAGTGLGAMVTKMEGQNYTVRKVDLAREGGIESARTPELADGATLEPATLAQVARALDLAEARGARRAVVVAEGRSFIADIASRRLERLETRDDFIFEEVDAAIAIRGESATYSARALGPRALPPREIAEQFESSSSTRASRPERLSA
jgi:hypothetical protein